MQLSNQAFENALGMNELNSWKYSIPEIIEISAVLSARYISTVWTKTSKQINKQKTNIGLWVL